MPEIVKEFYEGGRYNWQYRLYDAEGRAVEPIASIPIEVWLKYNAAKHDEIRDAIVKASCLIYPELTEEQPKDGTNAKRRRDKATDGAPIDSDDAPNADQPSEGSEPARKRG